MTTSNRLSRLREILRLNSLGISQRQIAMSCGCSRNTVQDVLIRCQVAKINWPLPENLSEDKVLAILYPAETPASDQKKDSLVGKAAPDYKYVHQELARKGVNLKLLWSEYVTGCKSAGSDYLQYSQFCVRYRQYAHRTQATMHISHKPGEKCSVDWAGTTYDIWNQETGEAIPTYLFVGTLNSSKYTFVKAYPDTKLTSWTTAHVEMFNYFQGVPRIVVPDNCKTAVIKTSTSDEPVLNQSYLEMAEYYGFAVIPARPRRPKDKPAVEKSVDVATTWILGALRKRLFFNLSDLNDAIAEKLEELNDRPFQKLAGSRRSAFLGEEVAALQPLPQTPFELAIWKTAMVGLNYHIEVDKSFYSVLYHYIKHKVDVRLTSRTLEIFYQGRRISSHPRHYGKPGHYETNPDHMPSNHQAYREWNGERFRRWAANVGPQTEAVIDAVLNARAHEQQAYRGCLSLLKLADKFTPDRLEKACEKAILLGAPRFRIVRNILESGQDQIGLKNPQPVDNNPETIIHRNIRGNDYYAQLAREMQARQIHIESLNTEAQGEENHAQPSNHHQA